MWCVIYVFADDETEKSVSVLLDGEESTLEFLDVSHQQVSYLLFY